MGEPANVVSFDPTSLGPDPDGVGSATLASQAEAAAPPDPDLRHDSVERSTGDTTETVVRGARPMMTAQIVTVATRAIVSLLTAVLLVPKDLGIIAIAATIMMFLDQIRDMGTGVTLIQRAALKNSVICTIFLFNLLVGASLTLVQFATAAPLASWLNEPSARGVLMALAPCALILSTGQVHHALLRRDLRYREIALVSMFGTLANGIVTIAGALAGWGAWALAAGIGVGYLVDTALSWYYDKWRPWAEWHVDWRGTNEVVGFSLNVFFANFVRFLFAETDTIVVQLLLGTSSLGLYSYAQRILSYPQSAVSNIVGELTLPAFAKHQTDDEALARGITRSAGVVAVLTFPMMAGLAAVARPVVNGLLAPAWHDLTPLIWLLAPFGAGVSISVMCGSLLLAKGSGRGYFRWVMISTAPVMIAFVIGLYWGLIAACGFSTGVFFLLAPYYLHLCLREINLGVWRFLASLAPTAAITTVMVGVVLGVDALAGRYLSVLPVLAIGVASGGAVYLGAMYLFRPPAFEDAVSTILRRNRTAGDAVAAEV
jgi:PST family polysaccharide transporter